MTKFRTRILPQLLAGQKQSGKLPRPTFALAALIAFYRGERNGEVYPVQGRRRWIARFRTLWAQHRDGQLFNAGSGNVGVVGRIALAAGSDAGAD